MKSGILEIIEKKRDGQKLDKAEIEFFTEGAACGSWRDYQISALLMAMYINGLDDQETTDLTLAMAASGKQYDLAGLGILAVDKHSTGGVADTTTLIAAPLAAACGAAVFKVSGRGLGFTGGTIDKLESIPGFNVELSEQQAVNQVRKIQIAVLSQTGDLTPADKKLYAIRDVTATIDSIPLIAASIMSKKIAAGASSIMLDVKCGSGAFMHTLDEARELADTMVRIGQKAHKKTAAIITGMNQPLGSNIGNSLEVIEAIEVLKGRTGGDLLKVSLKLAANMLLMSGLARTGEEAERKLKQVLASGLALEKFRSLLMEQGGDARVVDNYELFPQTPLKQSVYLKKTGYLSHMKTDLIGKAFVAAGGGRLSKEDTIDYAAGIVLNKRLGDFINIDEPVAEIFASTEGKLNSARSMLESAITIADKPPVLDPVILDNIAAL